MDQASSCGSNSSTMGKKLEKPPPFKLCFSKDRLVGKSNIRVSKVNGDSITPKFYSKEYENTTIDFDTINKQEESLEQQNSCNCNKRRALLTSHSYGWWHEHGLQLIESRFDFRKKISDLANFGTNMQKVEDRKFENSKHGNA